MEAEETFTEEEVQGKQLEKKIPYPKSVFFIATNEFCERFCYYGMRTVLSLYLTDYLLYNESDATVIYHTFIMLAYFFPLFGAVIADGFLGKYKTTIYISIIYATGGIVLSLAAITPLGLPHREFSLLGLCLIAIGTGGIKPCVLPLGGDQFILPQQERLMAQFFSIYFFSVNLGSLISTVITPILREDVHCFREDSCFPLAFGLPSILMITSIVVIALGRPFIRDIPPEGNLLYKVTACMCYSVKLRLTSKVSKVSHWLDHSKPKYGEKLVEDIKRTLNVIYMFLPMPVLWALIDQTGSTWTFQARRMNGDIGFYTILPDQLQLGNAAFYLLFIPICEYVVYPICQKMNLLRTTLQKITCGGVIAALGFVCSACVSIAVEATYPVLPTAGIGQIRIYNTLSCNIDITTNLTGSERIFLASGDYYKNIDVELSDNKMFSYSLQSNCANFSGSFQVYEENSVGYYFDNSGSKFFADDVSKHFKGLPQIRNLVNSDGQLYNVTYKNSKGDKVLVTNSSDNSLYSISPDIYQITIGNYEYEYKFYLGGVYAVLAIPNSNETTFEAFTVEVTAANSIHMLWAVPQYALLTLGEMMFSIAATEFSYSQAPVSMKSVVVSCWLLTITTGNLIVVLMEAASIFELGSSNAFLYTGMMLAAMLIFALMAMRYKYVEIEKPVEIEEMKKSKLNS